MPFVLPPEWEVLRETGRLLTDVPMSSHTTLKIGGKADVLADPADETELAMLLRVAAGAGLPVAVVGRGSNLVVRDGGIRGVTIRIAARFGGISVQGGTIGAMAGTSLSALAVFAANAGLSGLEAVSGIPGTVGGGIIMNAGAYGHDLGETVMSVRGIMPDGASFSYTGEQMGFGYRISRLQGTAAVVTGADFTLAHADKTEILGQMEAYNARRREKQPLDMPNCGSVFKRPEGYYAGTLIESCGLKGLRVGCCEVSRMHAGFIVNTGGATADDFLRLMELVRLKVHEQTGVLLEPEVTVLGEGL